MKEWKKEGMKQGEEKGIVCVVGEARKKGETRDWAYKYVW